MTTQEQIQALVEYIIANVEVNEYFWQSLDSLELDIEQDDIIIKGVETYFDKDIPIDNFVECPRCTDGFIYTEEEQRIGYCPTCNQSGTIILLDDKLDFFVWLQSRLEAEMRKRTEHLNFATFSPSNVYQLALTTTRKLYRDNK